MMGYIFMDLDDVRREPFVTAVGSLVLPVREGEEVDVEVAVKDPDEQADPFAGSMG